MLSAAQIPIILAFALLALWLILMIWCLYSIALLRFPFDQRSIEVRVLTEHGSLHHYYEGRCLISSAFGLLLYGDKQKLKLNWIPLADIHKDRPISIGWVPEGIPFHIDLPSYPTSVYSTK